MPLTKDRPKMFRIFNIAIAIFLLLNTGCMKNLYPIEREDLGTAMSLTLDGSKRSILVNKKNGRFCSEPPPDAIAQIAAKLTASLSAPNAGVQASGTGNLDVNILSLFQRSQGVQVLRDGMYRVCEAYLNEAIEAGDYRSQMVQLVSTLNYIVPVELCTKALLDGGLKSAPVMGKGIGEQAVAETDLRIKIYDNCIQTSFKFAQKTMDASQFIKSK